MTHTKIQAAPVLTKAKCVTCQTSLNTEEWQDRTQLSNQCYQCVGKMTYQEIQAARVLTNEKCMNCRITLDTEEWQDRKKMSNNCYQCYNDTLPDTQPETSFGSLQTYAWDDDSEDSI